MVLGRKLIHKNRNSYTQNRSWLTQHTNVQLISKHVLSMKISLDFMKKTNINCKKQFQTRLESCSNFMVHLTNHLH